MSKAFKVAPFCTSNVSDAWVLVVDGLFGFFDTEVQANEVYESIGDIEESPFGDVQLIPPKYVRCNRFTNQPEARDTITRDDDRAISVGKYVSLKRGIYKKYDLVMFGPSSNLTDQEMAVNRIKRSQEVGHMINRLIDSRKVDRAYADICNNRYSLSKDWIWTRLDAIAEPLHAKRRTNPNPTTFFERFEEIDERTPEEINLCKRVAKILEMRKKQLAYREKALRTILEESGFDGAPC